MSRSQLRNSLTHINPALSSSVAGNWKQLRTAVRFSLAGCMGIEIVSLMNFGCWLGFSWRRERKTNHRPAMLGRTRRDIQIFLSSGLGFIGPRCKPTARFSDSLTSISRIYTSSLFSSSRFTSHRLLELIHKRLCWLLATHPAPAHKENAFLLRSNKTIDDRE